MTADEVIMGPSHSTAGAAIPAARTGRARRVAFVNQPRDPIVAGEEQSGSVAIVNWQLARHLAEMYEVVVYAPRSPGRPTTERWQGITIRRAPALALSVHKAMQLLSGRFATGQPYSTSPLFHRDYFMAVAADLAAKPADIVHLPQQLQFAPLFRRRLPGAKLVLHIHQDEVVRGDDRRARSQLASFDAIVTVSDHTSRVVSHYGPGLAARIHTIGNGVDTARFRPGVAAAGARRGGRLLFVGRVSPDKGVHVLLAAFERLARRHPDLELDIVGKPGLLPRDTVRLLAADDPATATLLDHYGRTTLDWFRREVMGQGQSYLAALDRLLSASTRARVRFHANIPLAELVALYRASDLFVLPSIWLESYGLPLVEAMATGIAVVASRAGGIPELVGDGVTGIMVERGDVPGLAGALDELLGDPERRLAMGLRGRERAVARLTWRHAAARLGEVYAGLG